MITLVCVSAKQHTSDVVTFACRLARESASEVIILHVQPGSWSHSKGYLEEREKEGLSESFAAFPDHLGQCFEVPCRHMPDAGVNVKPRQEESDDPAACILRVAEEEDVDLIVCRATVHRMVERLFQSSITARRARVALMTRNGSAASPGPDHQGPFEKPVVFKGSHRDSRSRCLFKMP